MFKPEDYDNSLVISAFKGTELTENSRVLVMTEKKEIIGLSLGGICIDAIAPFYFDSSEKKTTDIVEILGKIVSLENSNISAGFEIKVEKGKKLPFYCSYRQFYSYLKFLFEDCECFNKN